MDKRGLAITTCGRNKWSFPILQKVVLLNPLVYASEGLRGALVPQVPTPAGDCGVPGAGELRCAIAGCWTTPVSPQGRDVKESRRCNSDDPHIARLPSQGHLQFQLGRVAYAVRQTDDDL